MHVRRNAEQLDILAPAKINLFLEVLARRSDGFHEIETLMVKVSVYDSLVFEPTPGGAIALECCFAAGQAAALAMRTALSEPARELHPDSVPCGPENLAWRAAALLKERAGASQGARIRLIKRIPAAAGLGGASSDAAAALVAANAGWRLAWPRDQLVELAQELGSDVPFFLAHRAGVGRGRGERIEEAPTTRLNMVIAKPPVGLSTPKVYQGCRPAAEPQSVSGIGDFLACGRTPDLGRALFNRLQPPAAELTPWIGRLADEFSRQAVLGHQMSGSGSSYFAICRSWRHARRVAATLRSRDVGTVLVAAAGGG